MNIRLEDASPLDLDVDLLVLGVAKDPTADTAALEARMPGVQAWLRGQGPTRRFEPGAGEAIVLPTYGRLPAPQVALVGVGDRTPADLRRAAGKAGQLARDQKAARLGVHLGALDAPSTAAVLEHVAIGNYVWDRFVAEDKRRPALTDLHLVGGDGEAQGRAVIRARWQQRCRDLVNAPAGELYPATLAEEAGKLASLPHVTVEVIDFETCKARGYVGIVAVGQGSTRPGCLIHISYNPPGATQTIALVGKAVTFDSGGLSLKPTDAMQTMRCDMGGGATVLAATGCAAELGLPVRVETFIPAVENMMSGDSYKLGDMLAYRNGVTVEIHNTDAEGRLILADALLLAGEVPGVSRIVDLATLTGAVIIGIGSDFTGYYATDDALASELQGAFDRAGELGWRLPLHAPYNRLLKGTWSQLKNVGGREAGSITAALFLQHFVPKGVKWAHLDIAGSAWVDAQNDPYAPGATGHGVRTLVQWLSSL